MMRANLAFGRRLVAAVLLGTSSFAAAEAAQVQTVRVESPRIQAVSVQVAQLETPEIQAATSDATDLYLDPGHFIWHPEASSTGPVRIVVSLPLQIAYVFRGGTLIGASSVSTGLPGYDTPVGAFPILQKEVDHHSSLYDDAPMPFMQRLTWDGVALHAGKVTGQPASHGCVRLPAAFARKLYDVTSLGATVVITDEATVTAADALAATAPAASDYAAR